MQVRVSVVSLLNALLQDCGECRGGKLVSLPLCTPFLVSNNSRLRHNNDSSSVHCVCCRHHKHHQRVVPRSSPKSHTRMYQTPLLVMGAVCIVIGHVSCDMMRKSIVFDPKTPKVFYCPQEKPVDSSKIIVKAISLDKLCEYGGNGIPKKAKSDCYNDVDESEYACAEKQRIEMRISPPEDLSETTTVIPTPDAPKHIKDNVELHKNAKKSTKYNGKKQ